MKPPLVVVDTNVVVSGLLSSQPQSPPCLVLDGMLEGRFPFLLSLELLSEYRRVLLRPRIRERHGLNEDEIDAILTQIVANGILREARPVPNRTPDEGDDHLWALLALQPGTVLVTGDQALIDNPPDSAAVLSPRGFVTLLEA